MKIYLIKQKQFLPIRLSEAWNFFSNPRNLADITPSNMDFKILYLSGEGNMYAGQLIQYKIKIFPGVWVNWLTEITHLKNGEYFVDEQRFGPYALWHHEHYFKEVPGGIEMTDEVNYGMPFGLLGRLVHWIFVGREVNAIFAHRYQVLEERFTRAHAQIEILA